MTHVLTHRSRPNFDSKRTGRVPVEAGRTPTESNSILEALQSKAPVGLGFLDRSLRVVRANEKLAEFATLPMADQIGRKLSDILPVDVADRIEPMLQRVLDTGEAIIDFEMTKVLPNRPGQLQHHLVSYYPVHVDDEIIGVGVVLVDITERKEAEDARRQLSRAAVDAMAATVEARDPYTAGHQRRVAELSSAIASELGLSDFEIEGISLAANIHDIGKIRIPAEILARPGQLQAAEFELVKTHCQVGYEIVSGIKFPWAVAEMILQHHERFDGAGYPNGLRGNEIVFGARIIAVADVVEAMSSHRPYRAALGLSAAIHEIKKGRGSLFDPAVVDALIRVTESGELPFAHSNGAR